MRYLRSLRPWFGVPVVLVGVVISLLTNIATTEPTWWIIAGLVAAVVVLVGLTVGQAGRNDQDRLKTLRAARATVLKPLRPDTPKAHTISTLLAAEHALAPFRARHTEMQTLRRWCLDAAAPAIHVLAGPGGVGKSRLAVEVAGRLPDEWVTGRCVGGQAEHLLPAVLACQEPTLIVVDDADTEPGVASLVQQIGEREERGQVKVLLLVRDAAVFEKWVHHRLPDSHRGHLTTTTLAVLGEAGDRRRWFVEAARAYAAALGVAPLPVLDMDTRPVGTDGEAMVVIQARAVLAALAGTCDRAGALRATSIDRVTAELIEHERQRWNRAADDPRWGLPASFTIEARQESLLALVLLAPATPAEATAVLRRLPRFREETEENLLRNVIAWAHHLYPGLGPAQVEPAPDFLRGAMLATLTSPAQTEVTDSLLSALSAQQSSDVLTRLIRAAALFDTVAPLIGKVVHDQPSILTAAIESLVLTGPNAKGVERYVLVAITPDLLDADEVNRLLNLLGSTRLNHLRAALQKLAVQRARDARDKDDTEEARTALARSRTSLGSSLREVGQHREALASFEETVELWRELAAQEPARHTPDLADSLRNLGISLREVGRDREALAAFEEAVELWRELAAQEPARHTPDLADSLHNLGGSMGEVGQYRDALAISVEAVGLWRDLAAHEPARHIPNLARSLHNLGGSMGEVGQYRDALAISVEAVGLWRDLAAQEPARHIPNLANSLHNLGVDLGEVGQPREAVTALEEAVGLWRNLAAQEPARHIPNLANSLTSLGFGLLKVARPRNAETALEEAVGLWRNLAAQEPSRHTANLAHSLHGLGLGKVGQPQEALTALEEAVGLWRNLAAQEPARHTANLAHSLYNLGIDLGEVGRPRDAATALKEAVGLGRRLAAQEPARHTPYLATVLTNLASRLCQLGRHDEELELRAEIAVRWRMLSQLDPDEYKDAYQCERDRLAASFSGHGREPGAAWRVEENLAHRLGVGMPPSKQPT